jgi:hypothetical protein
VPGHTKRQVVEWSFTTSRSYENPFADVAVDALITSPGGVTRSMPLFYDGNGEFKLRFNPGEAGTYTAQLTSRPADPDFAKSFSFDVEDRDARGFLRATPGGAWGFGYETGEPVFISGDTTYDLFAMAHCGGDAEGFLKRRKGQGFNLFRTRLTTSRFHLPDGHFEWQTKSCWPWGGSSTLPRFDLINLDYFRSVDRTIGVGEELGIGFEMIMEGWGNEFPFNSRQWFTPEWEALWMRYLIARYDAYNCVWFWTPLNEYEYYPNGDWHWKPAADRWALRIGRWIKETAPHGHVLSMHNGPRLPPFAQRFRADPEAVDAIMFQEWGTRDKESGWLAAGIEESIEAAFAGWQGSAVFAEWGYERDPTYRLKLPMHEFCDRSHTRRSAWRGITCGLGIIAGFEHSWGPWMDLETDQPGVGDLEILNRFMRDTLPFHTLRPAPGLATGDSTAGYEPRALQSHDGRVALVYFPAGGSARVSASGAAEWFDPRTERTSPAQAGDGGFTCPEEVDADGHPRDFVLVVRS